MIEPPVPGPVTSQRSPEAPIGALSDLSSHAAGFLRESLEQPPRQGTGADASRT